MAEGKKNTFQRLKKGQLNRKERRDLEAPEYRRPGTGDRAPKRGGGHRCRQRKSLRGRAPGPRSATGAGVRQLDGIWRGWPTG
jgi:hypothetical protein